MGIQSPKKSSTLFLVGCYVSVPAHAGTLCTSKSAIMYTVEVEMSRTRLISEADQIEELQELLRSVEHISKMLLTGVRRCSPVTTRSQPRHAVRCPEVRYVPSSVQVLRPLAPSRAAPLARAVFALANANESAQSGDDTMAAVGLQFRLYLAASTPRSSSADSDGNSSHRNVPADHAPTLLLQSPFLPSSPTPQLLHKEKQGRNKRRVQLFGQERPGEYPRRPLFTTPSLFQIFPPFFAHTYLTYLGLDPPLQSQSSTH